MNLVFIGFALHTLGEILIGFTAVAVHHRVLNQHRIDSKVFKTMKREQVVGVFGIFLIVIGYLLEVII